MIDVRQVEFDEIEEGWRELEAAGHAPTVFQTFDWVETWWRYLKEDAQLFLIGCFREGVLIGVVPFARKNIRIKGLFPFKMVFFMGAPESDYQDFIAAPEELNTVVISVFNWLHNNRTLWDIMWLGGIREQSLLNDLLTATCEKERFHVQKIKEVGCPYIELPDTYESFMTDLGGGTRRNLNRHHKRLKEIGAVQLTKTTENIEIGMIDFFELHERRWKRDGQIGALSKQGVKDFHIKVAAKLAKYLDLSFLELDGKKIACQYAYSLGTVRYNYLTGMDPEFNSYRIGSIITLYLIEDAVKAGLKVFDFMRGEEEYKSHFAKKTRYNQRYIIAASKFNYELFLFIEKASLIADGWKRGKK